MATMHLSAMEVLWKGSFAAETKSRKSAWQARRPERGHQRSPHEFGEAQQLSLRDDSTIAQAFHAQRIRLPAWRSETCTPPFGSKSRDWRQRKRGLAGQLP